MNAEQLAERLRNLSPWLAYESDKQLFLDAANELDSLHNQLLERGERDE